MAPTSNIFWCKVVFQKFIKHFRKMTDEQIVRDVRQSMDDIEDLVFDTDTFGACMVRWALERSEGPFATAARENGKKGGRPRKNPQDASNGNAGVDGKSATSCDQLTADGDTREDSHDGKSGTSANNCGPRQAKNGDAPHREAEDESATVSKNMRRVPQNEAPAHGTMSRSPEAAAQSGKVSALDMPGPDKGEQSAKTRDSRGSGRGSGRYQPPSLGPEEGNVHDQETDKVSTDAKPEKRRYGKYRHVLLTDEEGRKLRESLGEDLEDAVAILDEYIQSLPVKAKWAKKNGAKWWMQEYEAKDHYIVLHHGWARKRLNEMRTEELNAKAAELRYSAAETNAKAAEKRLENANSSSQPRQMYLTSDDISRRNAEEGWRQLQLMHQMEGNG